MCYYGGHGRKRSGALGRRQNAKSNLEEEASRERPQTCKGALVEEGIRVKAFLENFAAVVGAFTVAVFSMSWAHEYGYFWSVGRQFQTFLTTTDYLTNSALWMPVALFYVYNYIDWWRFGEEGPPKWDWKKRSTYVWLVLGILIFISWSLSVTWPLPFFSVLLTLTWVSILWSYFWRGYANRISVDEPFQGPLKQTIRFGPVFLVGMFLYGSVDANADLTRTDNPYLFTFKSQTAPKLEIFLRNFDKGALVRDAVSHTIEFHKWDEVMSISLVESKQSRTPWCWITGLMCNAPAPMTP